MGMKKTEVGLIPEEWNVQSFSDTFRILNNNTFPRGELNYDGGQFKNVHYGDVLILFPEILDCARSDLPYINNECKISGSAQPLQDGDVVIADTAEDETVGKATEIINSEGKLVMSGLHTIPCRVKSGDFAPKWLGYYINSHIYHDQLLPFIHGTKVSSISKSSLSNTVIVIPSVPEQRAIVNVLSDIDALIADLQKLIKKYRMIKQGCLSKMFPRGGESAPEMRLPGFTAPWEQRKLGEICIKTGSGGTPTSTNATYYGGNIPFLSISDIDGRYITTTEKTITKSGLNSSAAWIVPKGSIALAMYASVGKIGILCMDSATSQAFFNMVFDNEIKRDYVYVALEKMELNSEWERLISTGTQRNLNAEKVKSCLIPFPSIAEQQAIGQFFKNLDHLITLYQRKLEKYKNIKQGMLEELLTGKVRLS